MFEQIAEDIYRKQTSNGRVLHAYKSGDETFVPFDPSNGPAEQEMARISAQLSDNRFRPFGINPSIRDGELWISFWGYRDAYVGKLGEATIDDLSHAILRILLQRPRGGA